MTRRSLMAIVVYLFAVLAIGAGENEKEVTILAYGDSITENHRWRYFMWKKFVDVGYTLDFQGSIEDHFHPFIREAVSEQDMESLQRVRPKAVYGDPKKSNLDDPRYDPKVFTPDYKGKVFDHDIEAVFGQYAKGLYLNLNGGHSNLPERLKSLPKKLDFAIIHIGTNDATRGNATIDNETIPYIEKSIEAMMAHNPDVTILLSQVIPTASPESKRQKAINYLNSKIPAVAAKYPKRVVVVDQTAGFDPTKGKDTYDGIHPSNSGGEKMARKYYQAIIDTMGLPLGIQVGKNNITVP